MYNVLYIAWLCSGLSVIHSRVSDLYHNTFQLGRDPSTATVLVGATGAVEWHANQCKDNMCY